jgi:type II secretory pathway pseudopilin PulG
MRTAAREGFTLLEVCVAVGLASVIIGGGLGVTRSSGELARTTMAQEDATRRVDAALRAFTDQLRHASLATVQRPDGTPFPAGATDAGLRCRRVGGFSGGVTLAPASTLRFVLPAGATTGALVRRTGTTDETIVRGLTALSVERTADSFVVIVSARSGAADDRGRTARGSVTLGCRNP